MSVYLESFLQFTKSTPSSQYAHCPAKYLSTSPPPHDDSLRKYDWFGKLKSKDQIRLDQIRLDQIRFVLQPIICLQIIGFSLRYDNLFVSDLLKYLFFRLMYLIWFLFYLSISCTQQRLVRFIPRLQLHFNWFESNLIEFNFASAETISIFYYSIVSPILDFIFKLTENNIFKTHIKKLINLFYANKAKPLYPQNYSEYRQ